MSELCDLGACELQRLIGGKEISPVELLASCMERIEAVNPVLNAIVALDPEAAKRSARAAEVAVQRGDRLGPLHGLPVGIKDLNETAGLRTTYGSRLFADYVPRHDEPLVADIRAAGAIILGKTNTPEFGAGANTVKVSRSVREALSDIETDLPGIEAALRAGKLSWTKARLLCRVATAEDG